MKHSFNPLRPRTTEPPKQPLATKKDPNGVDTLSNTDIRIWLSRWLSRMRRVDQKKDSER